MKADDSVYEELNSDIASSSNYKQWTSNLYYEGRISDKVTINFNGDILHRDRKATGKIWKTGVKPKLMK